MSHEAPSILIVDDEFSVRDSLFHWFRKDGFRVAAAENATAALHECEKQAWDVVLLDIRMPGMDGMELLHKLRAVAASSVVIMLTAYGSIETAVEALRCGAADYRTKPIDPDELSRAVKTALEQRKEKAPDGREHVASAALGGGEELVSHSPQMASVLQMVESLATSDVTVLIRGESGTGKELIARAIHERSKRRLFPLVAINCGALPESLLETELFGHERGAFTGAQQRRRGKLEQADGGTLFLDEIGSITLRTQIELLRVLETKEFTRIGGQTPIHVDFRVVCATNQDLEEQVKKKEMREDLYFRINGFRIDLPPLRERTGDITLLSRHFVKLFAERTSKDVEDIAPDALAALNRHAWAGNVRELRNMMERGVILAEPPLLRMKDLVGISPAQNGFTGDEKPVAGSLAQLERGHIARVLEQSAWNISKAARVLDVDRVTLYNKIRKYGLRDV